MFHHLREKDYGDYSCIGTKVSKLELQELEDEAYLLKKQLKADRQMKDSLKKARTFEQLNNKNAEQLIQMSKASEDLENYYKKEEKLIRELQELNAGTLLPQLKEMKRQLEEKIETLREELQKRN